MRSYSQSGEQEVILSYFKDRTGTFCDIGANDGETLSNTRALALLGWSGVCVEPDPSAFIRLYNLCLTTQFVSCFNFAITEKDGPITLFSSGEHLKIGDTGLVSTLVASETTKWSDNTNFEEKAVDGLCWHSFQSLSGSTEYDFISIDAEGMDLQILKQMDLKKLGCRMLCIEWGLDQELRKEMSRIAYGFGLSLLYVSDQNLIFAV